MPADCSAASVPEVALTIASVPPQRLHECERLTQEGFGFSDRQVIPAREMFTVAEHGGICLGAFQGDSLVGHSYAFPAYDGERPYLFSFGLVVRRELRARGIGRRLKLAQRALALQIGYERIEWTADALASGSLFLYLTRLGARLVGYRPAMYEAVIPGWAADEVEIRWDLRAAAADRSPDVPAREVELPWDTSLVRARDPAALRRRRERVGAQISELLGAGYQGVEVVADRAAQRSFVQFVRMP